MIDPGGIANWSVTHVDWSEQKWYPKAYRIPDVTFNLLKSIAVCCHILSLIISLACIIFIQPSPYHLIIHVAVHRWKCACHQQREGKNFLLSWLQIFYQYLNSLFILFTTTEESNRRALLVEWNEATMLSIRQKV